MWHEARKQERLLKSMYVLNEDAPTRCLLSNWWHAYNLFHFFLGWSITEGELNAEENIMKKLSVNKPNSYELVVLGLMNLR